MGSTNFWESVKKMAQVVVAVMEIFEGDETDVVLRGGVNIRIATE